MSVTTHLNINVEEYDKRIRTFVPNYEEMISMTAGVLRLFEKESPTILDLGIGTGALSEQCLMACPDGHIIGVDVDPAMVRVAQKRLETYSFVELIEADFTKMTLPRCDAIVGTIALHHIQSSGEKRQFYRRCAAALERGGTFILADCFPSRNERLATRQREAWLTHLEKTYSRIEAEGHLAAWAGEDFYFPLSNELQWLGEAGFTTEIVWRQNAFAVIAARLER